MVLENLIGWDLVLFWGVFALFIISGGVFAIVVAYKKYWNFSWVLIEKGKIIRRGKCRMLSIGDGGEEIFFLRGVKKWRVAYGKRIGVNQIAWAIGKDGYWYNIELGDLDKQLMEVGVMPVDRDMRYAYASVRKLIDNRYNDKSFIEKWGATISIGLICLALLIQGVSYYYTVQKQGEINIQIAVANKDAMDSANKVVESVAVLMGKKEAPPVISTTPPEQGSGLAPIT